MHPAMSPPESDELSSALEADHDVVDRGYKQFARGWLDRAKAFRVASDATWLVVIDTDIKPLYGKQQGADIPLS